MARPRNPAVVVVVSACIALSMFVSRTTAAPASVPISIVQTCQSTGDLLAPQPPSAFDPAAGPVSGALALNVTRTTTFQQLIGFGGAITDAVAHVYADLHADLQQQFLGA